MKGITEIELTDIHTGKIEKYKETNLVTNAMADFFSHNINGMLFTIEGNTNDLNGNMLPLCKNAIGGILLFSDTIEENPNKYYAPSANPCVGYASNDVNATTNVMRGSMNLTETKKLDNGYKFVWDFTTSQANGTISCVALTHKWAGVGYMGDGYNGTGAVWIMRSRNANSSGQARTAYINAVEIDPEHNFLWTIGLNTNNELIIQKIRASFTSVGLNDTMLGTNYDVLSEVKLDLYKHSAFQVRSLSVQLRRILCKLYKAEFISVDTVSCDHKQSENIGNQDSRQDNENNIYDSGRIIQETGGSYGNVDMNYCYTNYPIIVKAEGYNGYRKAGVKKASAYKTNATGTSNTSAKKSVDELAKEVIAGKWSAGDERKQKLTAAGYDYGTIQAKVNELMKNQ